MNNVCKFFYVLDVVFIVGFNVVMVGMGDCEYLLYLVFIMLGIVYNVVNCFYMLKDLNFGLVLVGWVFLMEVNFVDFSLMVYSGIGLGFFVMLLNLGEKVVNVFFMVVGYIMFGINILVVLFDGVCYLNLGIVCIYLVSFLMGIGQNLNCLVVLDGGGFLFLLVYGVVLVNNGNGGMILVFVCFGCGNQMGIGGGGFVLVFV